MLIIQGIVNNNNTISLKSESIIKLITLSPIDVKLEKNTVIKKPILRLLLDVIAMLAEK